MSGLDGWNPIGYSTEADLPIAGEDNVTVTEASGTWTTKDSGERAEFANGGVRDSERGKARFDLVQPKNVPYKDQLLTRWAELMGRGAEKYNDRNWEQFGDQQALDRAKSSAFRHFMQWFNGELDEDHAAAAVFNIMVVEYVQGVLAGEWKALPNPDVQTLSDYVSTLLDRNVVPPHTLWTGGYYDEEPPIHVVELERTDRVSNQGDRLYRLRTGKWSWATRHAHSDKWFQRFLEGKEDSGFSWGNTGPDYYRFREVPQNTEAGGV